MNDQRSSLEVGGALGFGEEFDDEGSEVAARVEADHPEAASIRLSEL